MFFKKFDFDPDIADPEMDPELPEKSDPEIIFSDPTHCKCLQNNEAQDNKIKFYFQLCSLLIQKINFSRQKGLCKVLQSTWVLK